MKKKRFKSLNRIFSNPNLAGPKRKTSLLTWDYRIVCNMETGMYSICRVYYNRKSKRVGISELDGLRNWYEHQLKKSLVDILKSCNKEVIYIYGKEKDKLEMKQNKKKQ